jgi:hypothetical protein
VACDRSFLIRTKKGKYFGSEKAGAVYQECYGAVVDAAYVHILAEYSFLNSDAPLANKLDDLFVKLLCQHRLGGGIKTRSAAFAAIAVKGEIADEQNLSADIHYTSIHFASLVGKDAQVHELVGNKLGILQSIAPADTKVNQQAPADLPDYVVTDFDRGLQHSLHNHPHIYLSLIVSFLRRVICYRLFTNDQSEPR